MEKYKEQGCISYIMDPTIKDNLKTIKPIASKGFSNLPFLSIQAPLKIMFLKGRVHKRGKNIFFKGGM